MRIGLPVSLFSHSVLVVAGLFSLNFADPIEPRLIESISVDIIPITEFSNIRTGTLESEVLDTQTPSIVETPEPAQLAERAGNTEEDQVTPKDNEQVTPAPTEQSAPEPVPEPDPVPEPETAEPEPEPEPEPVPVVEPTPEPEPEPVPVPAEQVSEPVEAEPVVVTETETTVEPVAPTPRPVVRTASLDRQRDEYARRREQEEAREADQVSQIINAEESRGATTGEGGQATLGKPTGQAATLTRSEQDALAAQMRQCWRLLPGEIDSGLSVRLMVELNRDGSVIGTPRVTTSITSPILGSIARAAQRAVLQCGPYRLAVEKYAEWKQIDVTFKSSDLS